MILPSIELLCAVLKVDIELMENDKSINIFELAHDKCKEWAKEQSYILMIFGSVVYIVPDNFDADYFKFFNYKSFSEKTIQESIFAACEWILKETSNATN